jgi:hypothetical protein
MEEHDMASFVIFQVNPETEYRLSHALAEMTQRNERILSLDPKPKTNIKLNVKDVVYLWESSSKIPDEPRRLVARAEVTQAAITPMDMPTWQRTFCVDQATGQSGPQFHKTMPRAKIRIALLPTTNKVDRNVTNTIPTLQENSFLRKHGFYSKTIFSLTESEAQELNKLAGWKPLIF